MNTKKLDTGSLRVIVAVLFLISIGLVVARQAIAMEIGVEWINIFNGIYGATDTDYADDLADGFSDELARSDYWSERFSYGNGSAWESDFRAQAYGGYDYYYADNVDFLFLVTHGFRQNNQHRAVFTSERDSHLYSSREIVLGDWDLEWFAIYSCHSLDAEGFAWFYMWYRSFRGLHLILGYNGLTAAGWLYRGDGARFAQLLRNGDTVSRAWLRSQTESWHPDFTKKPAAMAAGDTVDDVWYVMDNDHVWFHGTTVYDRYNPVWFALRYYQ